MAIIKVKFDRAVEGASNIVDTGTEGTRVATGTSAQRGSIAGQIRFNSETGLAEYYTGTAFKTIDAPPTVTSLDVTEVDSQAGGNQTIVITGGNFSSGATVTFIGANGTNFNASTVTVDSATQITAVAPKASFLNAQEPYGVKVENSSGLSATLASQINVDTSPSWQTASGTLATIGDTTNANHATVSATDPDGDTVSYSETGGSVLSGAGLILNSSSGVISGDPTDVASDTTYTFTLRATANSKTADRSFNIIVQKALDGSSTSRSADSLSTLSNFVSTNGNYYIDFNGTPKLIYVDFDGTYTGDSSNAYMLYQSFGTTNYISSNSMNGTSVNFSNFSSNGWSVSADDQVNNSDHIQFYTGGTNDGSVETSSLGLGGLSVSNYAIKYGQLDYSPAEVVLQINGSTANTITTANTTTIHRGSINTSGTTPYIKVIEGNGYTSIATLYYIFFR